MTLVISCEKLQTLILNTAYLPIGVLSAERAFVNIFKGSLALVEAYEDRVFRTIDQEYPIPSIARTLRTVTRPYVALPLTRENIYKRDEYKCQYCGDRRPERITLDHIIPRSKGGGNTWKNMVTCCFSCNNAKGDTLLEDLGWEYPKTYRPNYISLVRKVENMVPSEWKPFMMAN